MSSYSYENEIIWPVLIIHAHINTKEEKLSLNINVRDKDIKLQQIQSVIIT